MINCFIKRGELTMVEMEINKIRIDEKRGEQIIVLKEKNGNRILPIVIGIMEVTAIKMELSGLKAPRPMTHDLFNNTMEKLGIKLQQIVINKLENNTFYAKLILKNNGSKITEIDSRPSDSIALALRAKVPIFVEEQVLVKVNSPMQ